MIAVVLLASSRRNVERPAVEALEPVGGFVLQPLQRRDVGLDRVCASRPNQRQLRGARVNAEKTPTDH